MKPTIPYMQAALKPCGHFSFVLLFASGKAAASAALPQPHKGKQVRASSGLECRVKMQLLEEEPRGHLTCSLPCFSVGRDGTMLSFVGLKAILNTGRRSHCLHGRPLQDQGKRRGSPLIVQSCAGIVCAPDCPQHITLHLWLRLRL